MDEDFVVSPDAHELVQELYQIWDSLNQSRMLEAWHDAQQIHEESLIFQSWYCGFENPCTDRTDVLVCRCREINQIAPD